MYFPIVPSHLGAFSVSLQVFRYLKFSILTMYRQVRVSLLCFFAIVTLPQIVFSMKEVTFESWNCEAICSSNGGYSVPDICAALGPFYSGSIDGDSIKSMSGCTDEKVELLDTSGNKVYPTKRVGLCTLSQSKTKCVTKGQNAKDIYTYDYDSAKNCIPERHWQDFLN